GFSDFLDSTCKRGGTTKDQPTQRAPRPPGGVRRRPKNREPPTRRSAGRETPARPPRPARRASEGARQAAGQEAGQEEEAGEARQEEGREEGVEEGQEGQESLEGRQEEGREEKALAPGQLGVEPGAGDHPGPLNGPRRDSEYFGRLLFGEAAEVPELHDAHLPRMDRAEPIERLADGEHLVVRLGEVDARHVTLD